MDRRSRIRRIATRPEAIIYGSVACERVVPDVEGFHALALQRPIEPPLTEKEIGAKEKDVKRLRDSVTLVADSHGHFLVEPIIKRHTSLVPNVGASGKLANKRVCFSGPIGPIPRGRQQSFFEREADFKLFRNEI